MNRPITESERALLGHFFEKLPELLSIIERIAQSGGHAFLVGGAVRDMLCRLPLKDIDIEVHGLELETLKTILAEFGPVALVGKVYGVLKLLNTHPSDWSIPRQDGPGRKPTVACDPQMGIEAALRRRDVTMNAMAIDLHEMVLVDPFGGEQDMAAKRLRCTDPSVFIEDPLRFFRVMQFVGRFDMRPDEVLNEVCRVMDIKGVARERVVVEFDKLLLLSPAPSQGLRWLADVGRLDDVLPEVAALVAIEQNPRWHPEGTVFEHTMQVVDAMARTIRNNDGLTELTQKILMYTALCHDLGKVTTTRLAEDGRIISHGHEAAGVDCAKRMMKRLTDHHELIDAVCRLVRHHMAPGSFVENNARPSAYKRLALKLGPTLSLELLAKVADADRRGRNGAGREPLLLPPDDDVERFVEAARGAGVLEHPEPPVLTGADLMTRLPPGPRIGELLKRAYEVQINESIADREVLLARVWKEFLGE